MQFSCNMEIGEVRNMNQIQTSPTTLAHFLWGFFDDRPNSCIANLFEIKIIPVRRLFHENQCIILYRSIFEAAIIKCTI